MIADNLVDPKPLENILRVFSYRPEWTFTLVCGVLIIRAMVIDADDHKRLVPLTLHKTLPSCVTNDFDWVRWLFCQIIEVEEHEAREFFQIDGVKVYDPHG